VASSEHVSESSGSIKGGGIPWSFDRPSGSLDRIS
jgi:hypothetical protein